MIATASSKAVRNFRLEWLLVPAALAAWSVAAVFWFYRQGGLLNYGDAEAHLKIARRILDSRTPGYDQIGTVWLPLPHLLLMPFAIQDRLWVSGLAAAIPTAASWIAAGTFLFAAARRALGSGAAAVAATGLFALNPNLLYLQSTAMTEPVFIAAFLGLLAASLRLGKTRSWGAVLLAALATLAGTLTRYEGWFLVPFATLYVAWAGGRRRWLKAAVFGAIASLGPLYWVAHTWWVAGDPWAFYSGPYSAKAIQGTALYPGQADWAKAWVQFQAAVRLCAGAPLVWMGLAGAVAALLRRTFGPLLLLALPGVFYIWSVHSSGPPIFVPTLWPHSYYNTRYGLAWLPLLVFAAGALVTVAPRRLQPMAAAAVVAAGASGWLIHWRQDDWVVWKESQVNSTARRAWTREAAGFLAPQYRRGSGIITSSNDLMGIFRSMGIPIRETLTGDNGLIWDAAVARPDLFLREEWAVVMGGDPVQTAINRARRTGPRYALAATIVVRGAPVIEIYRRALSEAP